MNGAQKRDPNSSLKGPRRLPTEDILHDLHPQEAPNESSTRSSRPS